MNDVTERIIGCACRVANALGAGFLEKVYENALAHDLMKAHLRVGQQRAIPVMYDGVIVGDYVAVLIVEATVIIDVKSCRAFDDVHVAQCLNYLKATGLQVCLLINFGSPKVQIKRVVRGLRESGGSHVWVIKSLHESIHEATRSVHG